MFITALDLGSSTIKGVIAQQRKDGSVVFVKTIKKESKGIKRGDIQYPNETVKALSDVLNEIRHFEKKALKNLVIGLSSTKTGFHLSRAAVSIPRPDFEIIQEDVERVLQESTAVNIPPGWQILHSLPREFVIDGIEVDDTDVVGLSGKKLEVNVVLITAFSSVYKNFLKVSQLLFGKKAGLAGTLVFTPLASERAVLTKNQRELGVAMVDIGFGTTSIVVYQDGRMLLSKVLPIGAGNITNDIAIGLKCSVSVAEKIKRSYGCAYARDISVKEKIDLSEYDENLSSNISRRYVAEIIEARVREIFSLVDAELKGIAKAGKLPAGAVLVGGGARLSGIVDIARDELRFPAQVGFPNTEEYETSHGSVADNLDAPEMVGACGLIFTKTDTTSKHRPSIFPSQQKEEYGSWIKKIFAIVKASE